MHKKGLILATLLTVTLSACGTADTTLNETEIPVSSESTIEKEETAEPGEDTTAGAETEEDIWVPAEAPAVRIEVSEEEQREKELEILEQGTFLYAGETDKGFYPSDIAWLTEAEKDDGLAILYACEDKEHAGWGILGLAVDGGAGQRQQELYAIGDVGKERLEIISIEEILTLAECEKPGDIKSFSLGAWNGGRIAGLYYISAQQLEELENYHAQIEETEQIIHTYTGELSNKNASDNAKAVYAYLQDVYGTACLTGQMESTWMGSADYEMNYIEENTGKLPAIRGLDFMSNDFLGVANRAAEWWEKGGIVTICWHTGADFSSGYTECLEDDINWEEAFIPGTDTYNALLEGMDRAVPALQKLEDEGVPVLWRPFHELDGGWFWWSKGGADNFVKLWQMMYSRYTDYWGLDNLIWVYGYSSNGREMDAWYPGDDYVDLMGADSYTPGANADLFMECESIHPDGMPIVFHECGMIPSEEEMKEAETDWLYFMVWHTDWLTDTSMGNTVEYLNEVYNSEYFITLDELLALKQEK